MIPSRERTGKRVTRNPAYGKSSPVPPVNGLRTRNEPGYGQTLPKTFFLILLVNALCLATPATTLHWKCSSEAGPYQTETIRLENTGNLLVRLDGSLQLRNKNPGHLAFLQLRFKPELYSFTESMSSVKMLASGRFERDFRRWSWSVGSEFRQYAYHNLPADLTLKMYSVLADFTRQLFPGNLLLLHISYYRREFANQSRNRLDAPVVQAKLVHRFSKYLRGSAGVYLLWFSIEDRQPQENWRTSDGVQRGPTLSLEYRRKILLNLDYHLLWHASQQTLSFSYTQRLSFLFGKMLSSKWSLFFLINYSDNHFSLKESANLNLLFYPLENENRVYLKLQCDLRTNRALYVKIGYLKDNLVGQSISLSGWQAVAGFRLKR